MLVPDDPRSLSPQQPQSLWNNHPNAVLFLMTRLVDGFDQLFSSFHLNLFRSSGPSQSDPDLWICPLPQHLSKIWLSSDLTSLCARLLALSAVWFSFILLNSHTRCDFICYSRVVQLSHWVHILFTQLPSVNTFLLYFTFKASRSISWERLSHHTAQTPRFIQQLVQ